MLRRMTSAIALLAFAGAPVVSRTRLFCRYSGVEITDCTEQAVSERPVVELEGCCDPRVTRALGVAVNQEHLRGVGPAPLQALPASLFPAAPLVRGRSGVVWRAKATTGPPLFLTTRALLI